MFQRIRYPAQTKNRLVFRYDESTEKYDTSKFKPKYTENRLSVEEVERVMKEIQPFLEESTKTPVKTWFQFISCISLALVAAYCGLYDFEVRLEVLIAFGVLSLLCLFVIPIW